MVLHRGETRSLTVNNMNRFGENTMKPGYARIYTRDDDTFHILQITDLHTDQSEEANTKTWNDIHAMCAQFQPDFLAVTGDIWCGDARPTEAPSWMARDIERIGALGIPWGFAWGNHDWGVDTPAAQRQIAAAPNAVVPEGDGQGNYRVEIVSPQASECLWDLFFLNSHTICLLPEDVAWLAEEAQRLRTARGRTVPAIVFFHIPLLQYETARAEGRIHGPGPEDVAYWGDDGTRIEGIQRAGSVRACFVGHSHRNDFWFEDGGIVFAYGRATGHGGYGGEELPKGCKLIKLGAESAFQFATVFPNGRSENHAMFGLMGSDT